MAAAQPAVGRCTPRPGRGWRPPQHRPSGAPGSGTRLGVAGAGTGSPGSSGVARPPRSARRARTTSQGWSETVPSTRRPAAVGSRHPQVLEVVDAVHLEGRGLQLRPEAPAGPAASRARRGRTAAAGPGTGAATISTQRHTAVPLNPGFTAHARPRPPPSGRSAASRTARWSPAGARPAHAHTAPQQGRDRAPGRRGGRRSASGHTTT